MLQSTRNRFLVLALLALATVGARFIHQAHADPAALERRGASEEDRFWDLGRAPKPVEPLPDSQAGRFGIELKASLDRRAVLHGGDGTVHLEVSLQGREPETSFPRQGTDILVIVDRSGSMAGEKIYFAQEALRQLVGRLEEDDRLGLVAYDSDAQILIPMSYATTNARRQWRRTIDALTVRGNTNMSEGLDVGLNMLERNRRSNSPARVLLLSDGLANRGDASIEGLSRRVRRAIAGQFVISTMGIGEDFDEGLMTRLASVGTGAFYYLAKLAVLPRFFDAELRTANQTIATGATLELRLEPGVRVSNVMGLPFQQHGTSVAVPLGSLYADHERRVWVTLTVPTQRLSVLAIGEVFARFRAGGEAHRLAARSVPSIECVRSYAEFRAGILPDVWERAMLDEALSRNQEQIGDAIASGTAKDIDRAAADANSHRMLARDLGKSSVVAQIDALEQKAEVAKRAQTGPMPARQAEAKRQKADGYMRRNSGSYVNADPRAGY